MSELHPQLKADINQIIVLLYVHTLDHHELDVHDPLENFLSFCDSSI